MEKLLNSSDENTLRVLNSIYYRTMMDILERCIEVCDIDEVSANALRYVMLKPNNFKVNIYEGPVVYDEIEKEILEKTIRG